MAISDAGRDHFGFFFAPTFLAVLVLASVTRSASASIFSSFARAAEELAASNPNPNPFASPLLPLKVVQSAHKEERASREELLELAAQLQREISVKKECLAASTSCEEVDEVDDKALKRDEPGAEEQREEQSQHDDDEPLLFALCVAIGQPLPPSGKRPPTPGPNWFQNSAESTCRTLHEVHGFATKTVVGLGYDDDAWALNEVEDARLKALEEEEEEAAAAVGAGRGGRDEAGARTRTRGGSTSAGSRDEDTPRQQVSFSANWPRNTDEEKYGDLPVPAAGGGLPHLPPLTRASILQHLEDLYAAATRARRQLGQGRSRGKISRPALFLLYVNGHGFAQPAATVSSAKRKAADVYPGDDPFTPYVVPRGDHGAASCRGHPVTPPLPEAPEQIESLSGVDGLREVQTVNVTKNPECFSEPSGLHLDFNGVMEKWLKYRAAKQEHDHEQDVDDRKADRFVWVADICFAGALVDHLRNFHQAHLLQAASAKKRRRTSTAAKIIPGAEGRGRDVVFPLHEELVEHDTTSDELGIAVQAVCEASRMSYGHLDRGFYVNELNIFEKTTTKEEICRKLQAANLSPRNWFRTSAENLPQFTRWWQMTMRGCHEKADEFFQKKFYAMLREKVIEPGYPAQPQLFQHPQFYSTWGVSTRSAPEKIKNQPRELLSFCSWARRRSKLDIMEKERNSEGGPQPPRPPTESETTLAAHQLSTTRFYQPENAALNLNLLHQPSYFLEPSLLARGPPPPTVDEEEGSNISRTGHVMQKPLVLPKIQNDDLDCRKGEEQEHCSLPPPIASVLPFCSSDKTGTVGTAREPAVTMYGLVLRRGGTKSSTDASASSSASSRSRSSSSSSASTGLFGSSSSCSTRASSCGSTSSLSSSEDRLVGAAPPVEVDLGGGGSLSYLAAAPARPLRGNQPRGLGLRLRHETDVEKEPGSESKTAQVQKRKACEGSGASVVVFRCDGRRL